MAPRSELWVTCKTCSLTWPILNLPAEIEAVVKVTSKATCPKCYTGAKGINIATEADIVNALNQQPTKE